VTFFVFDTLRDKGVPHAEEIGKKIGKAFAQYPKWHRSERDLRELRKQVTFAIVAHEEDLNKVTAIVDDLFTILQKKAKA